MYTVKDTLTSTHKHNLTCICVYIHDAGKPAKYRDPLTGQPYADLAAFKQLRAAHAESNSDVGATKNTDSSEAGIYTHVHACMYVCTRQIKFIYIYTYIHKADAECDEENNITAIASTDQIHTYIHTYIAEGDKDNNTAASASSDQIHTYTYRHR
jgi:hypothetical protein